MTGKPVVVALRRVEVMRVPVGPLLAILAFAVGCDADVWPGQVGWMAVSAGGRRACALTLGGRAWCWGVTASEPTLVQGAPGFTAIAVGARRCVPAGGPACVETGIGHACGLDTDGRAWCWGANDYGQLGDGTTLDRALPVPVAGSIRYRSLRAGIGFTCAIAVDSLAFCWGFDGHGNLGVGVADTLAHPVPKAVARGVARLATGADHACGLDGEGAAFCWGNDLLARLGSDAAGRRGSSVPVPVNGVHRFTELSAGSAHACGLTAAGVVYCWGGNEDGELGADPGLALRRDPAPVVTPMLVALSTGVAAHTCGLTARGRAWCWGRDTNGQLGSGGGAPAGRTADASPYCSPVRTRARFRSLATGSDFTCGVTLDGHLLCWGRLPGAPARPRQAASPVDIPVPSAGGHARAGMFSHNRGIRFRDSVSAPGQQRGGPP